VPRTYDPEFRRRVVELVRAGRPVRVVAAELGLAEATVYRWKAQDLIDRGVKPGTSTSEQGDLVAARRRIRELETELALVKQAAKLFEEGVRPKAIYPVIAELAGQGFSAKRCCRILGVAASGFFMWRHRSPSPRQLRLAWLTELVRAIHADSRGTYGWRRVNAELVYGHGVVVNRKTVRKIMRIQGLHGLPGARKTFKRKATMATAADLVERRFDRPAPDQLWVTDITEHPTREGKVYCCVVLDVFSRRVVGWSIDSHQATPLVTNALGMAINNRNPLVDRTVIHSDHGSQGGFNWSSQHLDGEGLRWEHPDGVSRVWRVEHRCVHLVGRRWRGVSIGSSSGRRSPAGCRARTPRCRAVCHRRWAGGGSGRVVACHRPVWLRCRVATFRSRSAKRSQSCGPRASGCARSRVGSAETPQRSRGSCAVTPRPAAVVWTIAP
jgi:putative transposase